MGGGRCGGLGVWHAGLGWGQTGPHRGCEARRGRGLRALEGGVGHKKGSMAGPGIDVEER